MRRLTGIVSFMLVVGVALPLMAQEAGTFDDVPAGNPFAGDIEWS